MFEPIRASQEQNDDAKHTGPTLAARTQIRRPVYYCYAVIITAC